MRETLVRVFHAIVTISSGHHTDETDLLDISMYGWNQRLSPQGLDTVYHSPIEHAYTVYHSPIEHASHNKIEMLKTSKLSVHVRIAVVTAWQLQ